MNEIKRKLERETCNVHHQHPTVSVSGGNISITACCDDFYRRLEDKLGDLLIQGFDEAAGFGSSEII